MSRGSLILASAMLVACSDGGPRHEEADDLDAQTEVVVRTLDAGYTPPRSTRDGAVDASHDGGDASSEVDATVTEPVDATITTVDANVPVDTNPPVDAGAPIDASEPAKPCDLAGKWALALRGNVSSSTTQFTNSSGEARAWALLEVAGSNGSFTASTRVCGAEFPSIELRPEFGAESFVMQFPRGGAGLVSGSFALRSTADSVDLDAFSLLFGVKTFLTASDSWPADGTSVEIDSDLDQKAGVTVDWSTHDGKQQPPVDIAKTSRASDTQLTARVVVGASKLSGCDTWNGSSGAARMESHVLGCSIAGGGGCNDEQIAILEIIRPQYNADRTTLEAVRLAADANCDRVLEALD